MEKQMNLTQDIVKSIGFIKVDGSFNPFYYCLKINEEDPVENRYVKNEVIIAQDANNKWSLRDDDGDSCNFVKELKTLQDLVSAISEHSFKMGGNFRAAKIRQALVYLER